MRDEAVQERPESVDHTLGNHLVDNIAEGDRSEILQKDSIICLRYKHNGGNIYTRRYRSFIEESLDHFGNITFKDIPVSLKNLAGKPSGPGAFSTPIWNNASDISISDHYLRRASFISRVTMDWMMFSRSDRSVGLL